MLITNMKISLVTPSYNQGAYLESCMRSILDQQYPLLEYFVMDGGSSDGSVDIIRRYADRLAYWRSHPDRGHMDALQAGFDRSTGEIMGWLNSDDILAPWALRVAADIFRQFPQVDWITSLYPMVMNEEGVPCATRRVEGYHSRAFYRGKNAPLDPWFYSSMIQQESTFWRRSLWERAGARVDISRRVAGDFELWSRFFEHAELFAVEVPLGCFRYQRNSFSTREFDAYLDVCREVLRKYGYRPPGKLESLLRRFIRRLPDRIRPLTGLAYPVSRIAGLRKESTWTIHQDWIV
jgi:glycosyltransferase involved in cell wall biosynthesis